MERYGVVMAGGNGTRFWPIGRAEKPKQLLNLSGKDILLNEAADRLLNVVHKENIYVVTNRNYVELTKELTSGHIESKNILAEPCMRQTAACIGYAALCIRNVAGNVPMCVVPADHIIHNLPEFDKALNRAFELAEQGSLVTIGINPTYPATGYGYIHYADENVLQFIEKPSRQVAEQYLASGGYLWNAGMFVWTTERILEEMQLYMPETYEVLMTIDRALGTDHEKKVIEENYPSFPSISIDYGVMEKAKNIKVVKANFDWCDVGSLDTLPLLHQADGDGNVSIGGFACIDTKDCIMYTEQDKLIATVGVNNLIVVATDDVVLVCDKGRAQEVKNLVEKVGKFQ